MIRASADSAATPDRLWSLACDVERWGERLPTVDAVQPLGSGPIRVGSRFEVRQPGLPRAVWEVTQWDAHGRSFTWASTSPGVRSTAAHSVHEDAGGSRLELSVEWSGPLAPATELLIGRRARGMVETEAETFARLAEQPDAGTITEFLDHLAARTPTPAGGSVAALCTAQAAALVVMVARYCEDPVSAQRAERLVTWAQQLVADDERAFAGVAAAWALPRDTTAQAERRTAIDEALLLASEPQARVVETAVEVLVLIDQLRPAARAGLRADLVAAAEVARAGAAIARMNVESNLRTLPDSESRAHLLRRMGVTRERA